NDQRTGLQTHRARKASCVALRKSRKPTASPTTNGRPGRGNSRVVPRARGQTVQPISLPTQLRLLRVALGSDQFWGGPRTWVEAKLGGRFSHLRSADNAQESHRRQAACRREDDCGQTRGGRRYPVASMR